MFCSQNTMSLGFNTRLSLCFCFLLHLNNLLSGRTSGHETGPRVVVAEEGEDVVLPCSISTKENIVEKLFDWKKDGQEEVFMYENGTHYNNGLPGQDEQFKGRVSHYSDQLKFGNASIIITNTKIEDSGNYTCVFPRMTPRQLFKINLVVEPVFKDRSGEISGAASDPFITMADVTEAGVLLQCVVQCAFPKPTLLWKDCDANVLPAEEPQVSERGGRYSVVLQTTVTKTTSNRFYCEVKQEKIGHVVNKSITVPEKLFDDNSGYVAGFLAGVFVGALTLAVPAGFVLLVRKRKKGDQVPVRSSNNGASMCLVPESV